MLGANVNVIGMSYWGDMPQWSTGPTPLPDLINATAGKAILILPALESGFDNDHPETPFFEFHKDFPYSANKLAPKLEARIRQIRDQFAGHMDKWAQLYDREGVPRYAVQIIHAYSDAVPAQAEKSPDWVFANALQEIANSFDIKIGFTLDAIPGPPGSYTASPSQAGPIFSCFPAVLAIQGFASEVFSGKIQTSGPNELPIDNNKTNLYSIVDWKSRALQDWLATGMPVIYDVSSGFDGRFIWKEKGTSFWSDNLNYTEDRWRNALSQFKGNGIKGIIFNTWNGYTEGYAATQTSEHRLTVYNWLKDLYEPDPRQCSHMQYSGGAHTFRVYGAICEHWVGIGGDRGLMGEPLSPEMDSHLTGSRKQSFRNGKMYWSNSSGAHEVHGLILKTYLNVAEDSSCLGLPITDELPDGPNRMQKFQNGVIRWRVGESIGSHTCGAL